MQRPCGGNKLASQGQGPRKDGPWPGLLLASEPQRPEAYSLPPIPKPTQKPQNDVARLCPLKHFPPSGTSSFQMNFAIRGESGSSLLPGVVVNFFFPLFCYKHSLRPDFQNCVYIARSSCEVFRVCHRRAFGLSVAVWSETCHIEASLSPHRRVLV